MKKPFKVLSTALLAGSLLAGCGAASNADPAGNTGNTTRNVTYTPNTTSPNPAGVTNNGTRYNNGAYNAPSPNNLNTNLSTSPRNNAAGDLMNNASNNAGNVARNNVPGTNGNLGGTGTNGLNNVSYTLDNQTANNIANAVNKIKGVTYATTLINGNRVVVGIHTAATAKDPATLRNQVKKVVQKYVGNRNVTVVSDQTIVNRMTNLSDRVTNGTAGREVGSDVNAIFNDLGNAVQRPFQNNAK